MFDKTSALLKISRRAFLNSVMVLPLLPEALKRLGTDEILVDKTASTKLGEKSTNFVLGDGRGVTGSILEWEHYIEPHESRWDAYTSLWDRGTLPTRDDLRTLLQSEFGPTFYCFESWFDQHTSCDIFSYEESLDCLSDEHFAELAQYMKDWADAEPDYCNDEWMSFEVVDTSQDYALRFFKDGSGSGWKTDLGVVIVEGSHPGSSYCAAELTVPVEEANRRAIELGIPVRFRDGYQFGL